MVLKQGTAQQPERSSMKPAQGKSSDVRDTAQAGMQLPGWEWGKLHRPLKSMEQSQGSLRLSATDTDNVEMQQRSRRASYCLQKKHRVPPAPGEMPGAQKSVLPSPDYSGAKWLARNSLAGHRLAPHSTVLCHTAGFLLPVSSMCWQDIAGALT